MAIMLNETGELKDKKIGWILARDRAVASSRLQGHNIHEYLLKNDINSEIIAENLSEDCPKFSIKFFLLARRLLKGKYDLVLFNTPNWMMYKLSEFLRISGCKTIAIRCDYLPGPYDDYFDATILPTSKLQELLEVKHGMIIEDMVEVPIDTYKRDYAQKSQKLRVVWIGHQGYKHFITKFVEELRSNEYIESNFEFITISKGDWATHQWQLDTVFNYACDCDIAIIPMPQGDRFAVKSANRLTMFMALGLPSIITPINSYLAIAEDKINCLLANNVNEFIENLKHCADKGTRETIGQEARKFANTYFTADIIGEKWCQAIGKTLTADKRGVKVGMQARAIEKLLTI